MEREIFVKHFQAAATAALDFGRMFLLEPLSDAKCFRVRLNQSYDRNLDSDQEVYRTMVHMSERTICTNAQKRRSSKSCGGRAQFLNGLTYRLLLKPA